MDESCGKPPEHARRAFIEAAKEAGVACQLTVRMSSFRSGLVLNLRIWKVGFSD
ncbi:DUF982 domain-containing protein [Mesorhizobium sp. M0643]|uniref:DUF982 domain-containing protein n=1 Tax=Mesorhizobium sp. M0643 TaxID=2956978 RepID=UPI00333A05BA